MCRLVTFLSEEIKSHWRSDYSSKGLQVSFKIFFFEI